MALTWLVTGASSGFGYYVAIKALERGHKVIGTVRDETKSQEAIRAIKEKGGYIALLDMTWGQTKIKQAVQGIEKHYGDVDVLLNNAGQSWIAPLEHFE